MRARRLRNGRNRSELTLTFGHCGCGKAVTSRAITAVFALSWLVFPGFGLIDLTVTWDRSWPQVLEAGWGLFFTVLVGAAFVTVALMQRRAVAAIVQLYVAAAALGVSALLAREGTLILLALVLAVETAVVSWWATDRAFPHRPFELLAVSRPLGFLALVGLGPWLIYALDMFRLNRRDLSTSDVTIGVDHYSVQGAFGLAVAALAILAAIWPVGRRYIGVSVGVAAAYLGLVSLAWHPTPGSFGQAWSTLCMAWGAAIAVLCCASVRHRGKGARVHRDRTTLAS
jgi:hypothetical protein